MIQIIMKMIMIIIDNKTRSLPGDESPGEDGALLLGVDWYRWLLVRWLCPNSPLGKNGCEWWYGERLYDGNKPPLLLLPCGVLLVGVLGVPIIVGVCWLNLPPRLEDATEDGVFMTEFDRPLLLLLLTIPPWENRLLTWLP